MTAILRIEHPVADFDRWHEAFRSDPVGRERGSVQRYRIMRSGEDPNDVLIDLELDTPQLAEDFLEGLRRLWERVDMIRDPSTRIVELVEQRSVMSPERA